MQDQQYLLKDLEQNDNANECLVGSGHKARICMETGKRETLPGDIPTGLHDGETEGSGDQSEGAHQGSCKGTGGGGRVRLARAQTAWSETRDNKRRRPTRLDRV